MYPYDLVVESDMAKSAPVPHSISRSIVIDGIEEGTLLGLDEGIILGCTVGSSVGATVGR